MLCILIVVKPVVSMAPDLCIYHPTQQQNRQPKIARLHETENVYVR